jgi:predicted DNA binding CopG/RHH family protein
MKQDKLSKAEAKIEKDLLAGKYLPVTPQEEERFLAALARKRKDAILHIRINSIDLDRIKAKASKAGVPYQTFIAHVLHHVAR